MECAVLQQVDRWLHELLLVHRRRRIVCLPEREGTQVCERKPVQCGAPNYEYGFLVCAAILDGCNYEVNVRDARDGFHSMSSAALCKHGINPADADYTCAPYSASEKRVQHDYARWLVQRLDAIKAAARRVIR